MNGTTKQIKWAEEIQSAWLSRIQLAMRDTSRIIDDTCKQAYLQDKQALENALHLIQYNHSAKWFIDNRNNFGIVFGINKEVRRSIRLTDVADFLQ